jgi:hypothetical protein
MKTIKLSRGMFAFIDDEDFEDLNKYMWCASKHSGKFYALRKGPRPLKKTILMHREIMKTPNGMKTDHRDGNGLNNQRYNLRICTDVQNGQNQILHKNNTTGFKGVHFNKQRNKFQAQIKVSKKMMFLGNFPSAMSAAVAYDKAAKKHFGEFAKTNF